MLRQVQAGDLRQLEHHDNSTLERTLVQAVKARAYRKSTRSDCTWHRLLGSRRKMAISSMRHFCAAFEWQQPPRLRIFSEQLTGDSRRRGQIAPSYGSKIRWNISPRPF
ncbi:hypothetical protein KCP73_16425 [Salmonella enterica subsp. enterica]|nr:hypothetical protein KCP73_16425 [Salmonella enterica subsp. enterica]